jgi:ribonuclease HII
MSRPPKQASETLTSRLQEKALWHKGYQRVAGVDEAGRGPLAGPVVAAACIIGGELSLDGINDSKQLTRLKRAALFEALRASADVLIGVGIVDALTIDRINILQATIQAMHLALDNLAASPDYVLVDGRPIPHPTLPLEGIIRGDGVCYPIAAASIIAKETRDRMMEEYHRQWPCYGFDQHKGYGTRAHVEALRQHGPCPLHRNSFTIGKAWIE